MVIRSIVALPIVALAMPLRVPAQSPDLAVALKSKIDALKSPNVAWRQIQWKSCLLDGLKESREKKKPLMLWIFIDRPADDARC